MRKWLLGLAGFVLLVYGVLCAGLYSRQRTLMYFPQPLSSGAEVHTRVLQGSDPGIRISVRDVDGSSALVYFGGNAEDVSQNLPKFSAAFPAHAIYLLHYRGYGGSAGAPTEAGLAKDALALYDMARRMHRRVLVIGRSLGSGLAVRVASQRDVSRLVLVTPYDSLQDIAAGLYPWMPVRWLLIDKYESWRYAPQVRAPTLLIEAENDQVIPRASTRQLLTRFKPGTARLTVVRGTGHNDISQSPEYLRLLHGTPR
ncbi:MAG: hypothetical protein H7147_05040 [Frankiaceae bacterium]|nr:hypothetical protein [Arenimonas sp.]